MGISSFELVTPPTAKELLGQIESCVFKGCTFEVVLRRGDVLSQRRGEPDISLILRVVQAQHIDLGKLRILARVVESGSTVVFSIDDSHDDSRIESIQANLDPEPS